MFLQLMVIMYKAKSNLFLIGVPEQYIEAGKKAPVTLVIKEDGDKFSVQTITGPQSWTDEFEIGKPAMITGPGKRQMEVACPIVAYVNYAVIWHHLNMFLKISSCQLQYGT